MAKRTNKNREGKKDISKADIYVTEAPPELQTEPCSKTLFCVIIDKEVLRTPNGVPIIHEDPRALNELAAELEYSDVLDVEKISLYNLCSSQIDFIERDSSETPLEQVHLSLLNDPLFRLCAGPEIVDQLKFYQPVEAYLASYGIAFPHLPQTIEFDTPESAAEWCDPTFPQLVAHVDVVLRGLSKYQRTVLVTASTAFGSPTLAILLAKGCITPHEFAVMYLTSQGVNSKVWGFTSRNEEKKYLKAVTLDAECMSRYLQQFTPKLSGTELLIQSGESTNVEFKSSLCWNIRANMKDAKMEHAVLKSIVALLNTDGGTVLVGVEDNGNVLGVDADQFPNEDKYLLHFANLVNGRIGKRFADVIHWALETVGDKKVLRIDCDKGSSPVFLKTGEQEEFFIRTGPSTVQLTASEVLDYSRRRFSS